MIQKTNLDGLDVGKSKTVLADLKNSTDVVVDNEVVKKINFNTLKIKVNYLEKKMPDETNLIHISQ